ESEQLDSQERRSFQIERLSGVLLRNLLQFDFPLRLRQTAEIDNRQFYRRTAPHELFRPFGAVHKPGTQRGMAPDNLLNGPAQRDQIQGAVEPVRIRHVEKIAAAEQLTKNEKRFLSQRQRRLAFARYGLDRRQVPFRFALDHSF